MSGPRVSVVVPFFNEVESLPTLAQEVTAALEPVGWSYELILVDDGSTDGGRDVAVDLARRDPRIFLLGSAGNRGQSAALAAGFGAARGEIVVTLDADLQNDPADIPRVVTALDGDADVVSGVRVERRDTWVRRASSRIANRVRGAVLHDGVSDVCTQKAECGCGRASGWAGASRSASGCVDSVEAPAGPGTRATRNRGSSGPTRQTR